ncbi:MAG: flagellar biosynthesis protein FlhB [Planctomycetes bacterium]|nr:flagellar biosynthesis protein FlhB [Planctomycetota bacterium]
MAENENGAEKTELPTPKRLEQAREEGQVAYSHEASTAVGLLVGFSLLFLLAPYFWDGCASAMRWCLGVGLIGDRTPETMVRDMIQGHMTLIIALGVFLVAMFLVTVGMGAAQVGFHPTLKTLEPKLTKINPLTGLKRLFGVRGLMRFVLNVAKLALLFAIAWLVIAARLPNEVPITIEIGARLADDAHAMWKLGMILAASLMVIGLADLIYQQWQHTRDLMMTKQELKEEFKQMDGNPEVKGRIRQLQRQMAQRRMMQEVPKADVVITNPTHVAVALKYDKDNMAAPVVLAKGYDDVAQKIKAIAAEHDIPMVENVPLARALAREVQIGQPIKAKWFKPVAEILAAVYRLRKGAA